MLLLSGYLLDAMMGYGTSRLGMQRPPRAAVIPVTRRWPVAGSRAAVLRGLFVVLCEGVARLIVMMLNMMSFLPFGFVRGTGTDTFIGGLHHLILGVTSFLFGGVSLVGVSFRMEGKAFGNMDVAAMVIWVGRLDTCYVMTLLPFGCFRMGVMSYYVGMRDLLILIYLVGLIVGVTGRIMGLADMTVLAVWAGNGRAMTIATTIGLGGMSGRCTRWAFCVPCFVTFWA